VKQVIETNILALPEMDKSQLNLERITLKRVSTLKDNVERQQIYCVTLTICRMLFTTLHYDESQTLGLIVLIRNNNKGT